MYSDLQDSYLGMNYLLGSGAYLLITGYFLHKLQMSKTPQKHKVGVNGQCYGLEAHEGGVEVRNA
jgi:hypothetical protein